MGPPSYMRSVVDRNVVMCRIPVFEKFQLERSLASTGTTDTAVIRKQN